MKLIQTRKQDEVDNIPNIKLSVSNYRCMLFPSIFMLIIAMIFFMSIVPGEKKLFVVNLALVYPILFLIQGALALKTQSSHVLSLGASLFTYILIMTLFMHDSGIIFLVFYTIAYLVGLLVSQLIQQFKSSK